MAALKLPRQTRLLLIALAGLLAVGTYAPALVQADDEEPEEALIQRARERRARQADQAQMLVSVLNLTEGQVRRLLDVSQEAALIHVEIADEETRLLPEMLDAFHDFAQEDALNQGFSPSVEQRTSQVHHRAKELREGITARLLELEERAVAILTPAQKQAAKDLEARGGKGRGPGDKGTSSRKADRRRRGNRPDRNARSGSGQAASPSRQTSGRDRDRLQQAQEELRDLHRKIHPQLSRLGELLLHPAAAQAMCRMMGSRPTDAIQRATEVTVAGSDPATDEQLVQVRSLRTEINNWNLINGLHLGTDQIDRIVSLFDTYEAELEAAKQPRDIKRPRQKGRQKQPRLNPREQAFKKRLALERAVEKTLNPGQRQVLADYKACLLPPKDLKNPVRAGQANDHSAHETWLAKARKAPERRLKRMIEVGMEKEAERYGQLDEAERQARVDLLRAVVKEAATMSDTDFELNKAEIAERIAPRDRLGEIKKEIQLISRKRGLPGPIAQFLLKREFIDQLRQRGRQLAQGHLPTSDRER